MNTGVAKGIRWMVGMGVAAGVPTLLYLDSPKGDAFAIAAILMGICLGRVLLRAGL